MSNRGIVKAPFKSKKKSSLSIINWINTSIEQEEENKIGISFIYVMVGSGVASITAALAVYGSVSMPILITASILTMGTNVAVISQQTFKFSTWLFIVSLLINTFLLFYQIFTKS
jgi:hypothetical protein